MTAVNAVLFSQRVCHSIKQRRRHQAESREDAEQKSCRCFVCRANSMRADCRYASHVDARQALSGTHNSMNSSWASSRNKSKYVRYCRSRLKRTISKGSMRFKTIHEMQTVANSKKKRIDFYRSARVPAASQQQPPIKLLHLKRI